MRPDLARSPGSYLLPFICILSLVGVIYLSSLESATPWQIIKKLHDTAQLKKPASSSALHVRADLTDNVTAIVINDGPTDLDGTLTWDLAIGTGTNLIKLLDSDDLSMCSVEQSKFVDWNDLAESGWSKTYQGPPTEGAREGMEGGKGWKDAAEKLKFSSDGQKNVQYIFEQDQNTTIGGKSYRGSGGLYSNVLNTDGGIFALKNISPRNKGATGKPPLDGTPGNELFPLQTWADTTFLQWADACKGDDNCVKGLKTIAKCHTESNATNRIGVQALGGTGKWAVWPGQSFNKSSQQFAAIMGTAHGRGVAWLLLTHRKQLGKKYISGIDLWSGKDQDSSLNYYTFHLEDDTGGERSSPRLARSSSEMWSDMDGSSPVVESHVRRAEQTNKSSIVYDGSLTSPEYNKLFASDHSYNYEEAQKIGGYLVGLTQSLAEQYCVQQSQWNFSDLKANGWRSSTIPFSISSGLDTFTKALSDAKLDVNDEDIEHTTWKHSVATNIGGKTYPATHAEYDALYSKHTIVLRGASSPMSDSSKDGGNFYPPLKTLSDVLWLQWEDWSSAKKNNVTDLRVIIVNQTTDQYTSRIVEDILGNHSKSAYPGKLVEENSQELSAVLASPHGQGIVWFLNQHKSKLGTKQVKSVRIWTDQQPCLLFEISDYTPSDSEESQPAATKEPTDALPGSRRGLEARADTWDQAVTKGKRYLEMLECGTGTPARFLSYDDLATWGWKAEYDGHPSGKLSGVQAQAIEYLGGTAPLDQIWDVMDVHMIKTTVDGIAYLPTSATYENTYGPGFIISVNNWGPRSTGPEEYPPVDGPFPKLERQSDIMFLEYQRVMGLLEKPMTGLKGILRTTIANKETKDIVAKALGFASYNTVRLPDWPGVDFSAGSDEGAALLASPNGRAPVWLLATHKEALGHKIISKVRVFGKSSKLFLLFVFEDVQDDPSDDDEDGGVSLGEEKRDSAGRPINGLQGQTLVRIPQALSLNTRDDEPWAKAVKRGIELLEMLSCGSGPQSSWTYKDLATWGWVETSDKDLEVLDDEILAMKHLELSALPTKIRAVTNVHKLERHIEGVTYSPTHAEYSNHYEMELIVAPMNYGTDYMKKQAPKPLSNGNDRPDPKLRHLSDIWFLEYARVMALDKKPLNNLKGILCYSVSNSETRELIRRAWKVDTDLKTWWNDKSAKWPGIDFHAGSDEFAALLASPNGRGVAWLLITHKQLGKTVETVRVWASIERRKFMMLFVLKDATKEPSDETPTADQGKAQPDAIEHPSKRARALLQETYDELLNKGKKLVSALQSSDDCFPESEFTRYESLSEWGWSVDLDMDDTPVEGETSGIVANFLNAPWGEESNRLVLNVHNQESQKDGRIYHPTYASYANKYNPLLITASNNAGPSASGKKQTPPVTLYPDLARLSDVLFLEYERLMEDLYQPMDQLKGIWRKGIINQQTKDLCIRIAGNDGDEIAQIPTWPGTDFGADSDGLAALLASPNGVAVAYLLLQHRQQMGNKVVTGARVWRIGRQLHVLFLIGDAPVVVPSESNSIRRRDSVFSDSPSKPRSGVTPGLDSRGLEQTAHDALVKKGDTLVDEPDSQKLNDARDSGRYLIMAQESSTDVLESCFNIKQSTFTQTTQLTESGWTLVGDHHTVQEEDSDAATFDSWLDLNLDLSAGANRKIEYQHLDKTTGSDGTVYYPSGAYYDNLFTVGGIAALSNASPWKTGRNMNPQVDGKTRPFPPFRQWSDVVFLVYKDVCNNDPVKMKKLKGCLRHDVVNMPAREILHEYMNKHNELDSGNPKVWPGTLYKLDDDGFKVALGVPNGKGVAYLLATHREELGWKEIYMIRIFSVDWTSSYNILYYIRDHQESSQRRHEVMALSEGSQSTVSRSHNSEMPHGQELDQAHQINTTMGDLVSKVANPILLQSRASPDDAYEKVRSKGSNLMCQLYASASSVTQSTWKDFKSLEDYGWVASDPSFKWEYNAPDNDIGPALKDLGISTDGIDNVKHEYWHKEESKHDGHVYPATSGFYQNVFNVKGGAIIADSNYGPDYEKKFGTSAKTVPLKQYSDVVFLAWQQQAGDQVKNLKYVFRHNIVNSETRSLLNGILKKRGEQLKAWPGSKISMIESDALAILGTSNGLGVAYLLSQHKEQLGVKVIDSITIFDLDASGPMSLCFWIVDEEAGGAAIQASSGSTVESRGLGGGSLLVAPELSSLSGGTESIESSSSLWSAHLSWTKKLGKRFSKAAEVCWGMFRVL